MQNSAEKKPSRAVTVLGSLLAAPFILLLFAVGENEYLAAEWGRYVALGAALFVALTYRMLTRRSGHEVAWVAFALALYNAHMSLGGYLYLGWKAIPATLAPVALVYLVFRRRTRWWRVMTGVTIVGLVGLVLVMMNRDFTFLNKKRMCTAENRAVGELVYTVVPNPLHPYDFGGVSGEETIGVGYGFLRQSYLLRLDNMTLIKGDPINDGVQRVTPHPSRPLLAAPAWGHWGDNESVYLIDRNTGRVETQVFVPGCRNAFEVAFAGDFMYVLCEVSHSLHELIAAPPYEQERLLKLPGANSYDLAIDHERMLAYITDWLSPYLLEVDLREMRVVRKLWIGWSAFGIEFGPDNLLYIAQPLHGRVRVVDGRAMRVVRSIDAGYGPRDLDFEARRGLLFIANYFDGTIDAVKLADGTRLARLQVGRLPRGIWVDQSRDRLLIACGCGIRLVELPRWLGPAPEAAKKTDNSPANP